MKKLDTLVEDIYDKLSVLDKGEALDLSEEVLEDFGNSMKEALRHWATPRPRDTETLRMSNIGKPTRQLWYDMKADHTDKQPMEPHLFIRFLYGHLLEEVVLLLVKLAGHKVSDEQKEVKVSNVMGHMDCKIDGVVVDVKSTTPFGFKKFKDGTLAADDNFGYVDQIKAYAHAEGDRKWAWLAMDKQNGTLAVLEYDLDDTSHPMYKYYSADIEERVAHVKKSVGQEDRPSPCSYPVPDGKSGNLKLSTMCSYCQYKKHCYPTLRAFAYSTGPRFLTAVHNLPKVPEINLNAV